MVVPLVREGWGPFAGIESRTLRMAQIQRRSKAVLTTGGDRISPAMKRALLLSLPALGSLFLPASSLAGVDFQFPADGPMPKYFSGANNRASAKATVNGTTIGITRWELWLNDQKTAEADIPPGSTGLYVNEVAPKIIFTSTRFAPGTDISIVLKVWTTDGEAPVEAWSMPVPKKDVAAIFGRSEWESPPGEAMAGAHATKDLVAGAKYDVSRFFVSAGWSSSDVAATLGECSLFYANTHASDDSFQSDIAGDYMWAMRAYGDPNVLDLRTSAIGTGLPPFNSTGKPPITIAFLDSCFAGSSSIRSRLSRVTRHSFSTPSPLRGEGAWG